MIREVCKKLNVEYDTHVSHMSLKEFFEYMILNGYDLFELAYTYYKVLGFSDRLADIKANAVVEGDAL